MDITKDIKYAGVNDHDIDLFEGQYVVPNGMAYNSYVIFDEQPVVMDTVDAAFVDEWLVNVSRILDGRNPSYLVVSHMEPDHSAGIAEFMKRNPDTKIVATAAAFRMMTQFFGTDFTERKIVASENYELNTGRHTLKFMTAPMVHWPEVMVTYDSADKVLFSADGFGKFGALDKEEPWNDEAARYYFGIVGKFGDQVQSLLKKVSALDINIICSLHGPVLKENLSGYISLYDAWSSYKPEKKGVFIAYASVYGNTKKAAELLAKKISESGTECKTADLARSDMSGCIADAFRYEKIVLASSTYNMEVFPCMRTFINGLAERNFRNRKIALIENGTWAPMAAKVMKSLLEKCQGLEFAENQVTIKSALNTDSTEKINALCMELTK